MAKDVTWSKYQGEIDIYFQHEPDPVAQAFDSIGHKNPWDRELRYGAPFELMTTVFRRLKVADEIMPFRGKAYELQPPKLGEMGANYTQVATTDARPSCSQVLRARYGTQVASFDDSAPAGAELLKQAQEAYVEAAQRVPAMKKPPPRQEVQERMVAAAKERLRKDMAEAVRRLVEARRAR